MAQHTKSDYRRGMTIEGGAFPILRGNPDGSSAVSYRSPPRARPPSPAAPDLDAIRQRLDAVAAAIAALKKPR